MLGCAGGGASWSPVRDRNAGAVRIPGGLDEEAIDRPSEVEHSGGGDVVDGVVADIAVVREDDRHVGRGGVSAADNVKALRPASTPSSRRGGEANVPHRRRRLADRGRAIAGAGLSGPALASSVTTIGVPVAVLISAAASAYRVS